MTDQAQPPAPNETLSEDPSLEEEDEDSLSVDAEDLLDEVQRRQKNFGGVELGEGDNKDAIATVAQRFLEKFGKGLNDQSKPSQIALAVARATRDELRDNVYAHMLRSAELGLNIAGDVDDLVSEVDDLKRVMSSYQGELYKIFVAVTEVVTRQIAVTARLLATRVQLLQVQDEEAQILSRAVLDIYGMPLVSAAAEATPPAAAPAEASPVAVAVAEPVAAPIATPVAVPAAEPVPGASS